LNGNGYTFKGLAVTLVKNNNGMIMIHTAYHKAMTILLIVSLSSCSATKIPQLASFNQSDTVKIVYTSDLPTQEYPILIDDIDKWEAAKGGASTGALAGLGAAAAGCLTTGPLYFLCLLIVGSVSTGVGAGLGTVIYTADAMNSSLDKTQETNIIEINKKIYSSMKVDTQFINVFKEKSANSWQVDNVKPTKTLNINLTNISLLHKESGELNLGIQLIVTTFENNEITSERGFYYISQAFHIHLWRVENEAFLNDTFQNAYSQLSSDIINQLTIPTIE
jgi:hypothetical protein